MTSLTQFFILLALELGGLFAIYFLIKARLRRYLELENLLSGVREEARALVLELNETADRNVSLVEDRLTALRETLDEVDRRMGVQRRELDKREAEREVYTRLNKARPVVPEASPMASPLASPSASAYAAPSAPPSPISSVLPDREAAAPITLSLGEAEGSGGARALPEVRLSDEPVRIAKSRREEAFDLHRRGISADLIAVRLGATVAEIELLIEIEERRQANSGGSS
jgi:hypothetical protein